MIEEEREKSSVLESDHSMRGLLFSGGTESISSWASWALWNACSKKEGCWLPRFLSESRTIDVPVSQARPYFFPSTDRFQYSMKT